MILSVLLLSSCSEETVYIPEESPPAILQARPSPVTPNDVKFRVVTQDNLNEFLEEVTNLEGDLVFIAISVEDYERLSLNTQDLVRYIKQQKEIIIYYEGILTDDNTVL